ncbi:MAG: alanine--tRNA ligase-related protein [archaeon]
MKYQEAFLFDDSSEIVSVQSEEGYILAELDDTIFYPGGGGQPCDTGTIDNDSFLGEVIEVSKDKEKIFHKINVKKGSIKSGDKVTMHVNKDRRTKLVRMHTGEHILFKSLENCLEDVSLIKIDLAEEESSLFIKAKQVNWELLLKAEDMANSVIMEDRPLIIKEVSRDDALMLDKIRIKPDRIASDKIRVLEVKDFDLSACTGTHADSSGFVGNIVITKFSQSKGGWEIRYRVDASEELFRQSRIARRASSLLGTDIDGTLDSIMTLQKSAEEYKQRFRQVSARLLDHNLSEKINRFDLIYNIVEDVEKKQLVDKSNELAAGNNIVCFISITERATVLLNASADLNLNIPDILNKALEKFRGKGGGKGNFAMGSVDVIHANDVITELKSVLSNG